MEITDIIKDQNALMIALMGATYKDYQTYPEDPEHPRCDIVVGANVNNFSLRNAGQGIFLERLVRAIFPLEGENCAISDLYPIESLFSADMMELHVFRNMEQTTVRYEKGKRVLLKIEPDETAQTGILIRVEWNGGLDGNALLKKEGLLETLQEADSRWKPVLFFNGERVIWSKLAVNK